MLTKPRSNAALDSSTRGRNRRRKFSPLMLIGIGVTLVVAVIGVSVMVMQAKTSSHAAAAPNPNCTIIVPANALTAQGLATPYQLFAPDAAANGPCNEANANQGAFVQATIYNPATGAFSIYSPLVIDQGTQPAVAPVAPTLPANAVVSLWFGFNGTNLTLQGANNDANVLAQAQCTNGLNGSVFGQFAYCNARNFFGSVNQGIGNGLVKVPALGTAKDGMTCPTSRDFSVVDQDQSDNVQTQYLANGNGQTAQLTAANQAQLANATVLGNPSDNALITKFIDPALGCTPWTAPDLANNNTPNLSLALDEIQANAFQKAPIALVPLTDPMTLVNGAQSQDKTIAYRQGVDQNPGGILPTDGTTYCQNLVNTGLPRIKGDMTLTINATSPDPAMANSLFTFLAMRFMQSYTNLNCQNLINLPNPVTTTTTNGVVTAATITLPGTATGGTSQIATGNATMTLNANAGTANLNANVTYANHQNQQIKLNIAKNSCTGTVIASQVEDTNGNGQVTANTVINGLRGKNTIPNNWFFTVTDPNQNNAVVGCGSVTSNGTTGTATLGTVAGGTAATTTTTAQAPAAAGQTTAKNAPYAGKRSNAHGINGKW